MVKICPYEYKYDNNNNDNKDKIKDYFNKYPYPLHNFQKYSIQGTVENKNILAIAHTGSGKTLCAEFAIEYFVSQGKKIIYTTPLKSLSNQKFFDFTHKYPHISFGILTGDLKCNTQAQCLIMTTEILLNKLYQSTGTNIGNTMFDMNIQEDLGCVVMDEVHYINDKNRGHVWETTFMMIPSHIQLIMLSATIDKPEKFASWCEGVQNREVWVVSNPKRPVPLNHYGFLSVNTAIFKQIKDETLKKEIQDITNKPILLQSENGVFNEIQYFKINKMLKLFESKNVYVKRQHTLNKVCKYLFENNMLPALCFVFSRKQLEIYANEVGTILLEDDSKTPYTVHKECETILKKLPNYQEYMRLPEYVNMVALLEKGIAIHHAGVLAPLREMVEILFSKGFIKLLFSTETMSVGINMPVKTTIFTDVNKYDGNETRILLSHEYSQCSGRAGRLGLDNVGHVIHLNNMFRNLDCTSYKQMMNGCPQTLVSKFKISFNLLLNMVNIGLSGDSINFIKKSMIQLEIQDQWVQYKTTINNLDQEIFKIKDTLGRLKTPTDVLNDIIKITENLNMSGNKKRKTLEKQLVDYRDKYPTLNSDLNIRKNLEEKEKLRIQELKHKTNNEIYLSNRIETVFHYLRDEQFIDASFALVKKGAIASMLRETHCLAFAELVCDGSLFALNSVQLIGILSCFTNISVQEENQALSIESSGTKDVFVKKTMKKIEELYEKYKDFEKENNVDTGIEYQIHHDLIVFCMEWAECKNEIECKDVVQRLNKEKNVFLGEFVKALLKIVNCASELEKVAEFIGNIEFLSKLQDIPKMILKYVATNQSLYV
jgi:superfamily II RNA helicase